MSGTAPLVIRNVVGTGSPFDMLAIVPLVHQWGASRACGIETPERCDAPIRRIVILAPPGLIDDNGDPSDTLAFCEPHFQSFRARAAAPAEAREEGPDGG